jgi:excinuclease ABC subunit C
VKKSHLTTIKGVGDAKAKVLLEHFGTYEALKNATEEQLLQVKGISADTARNIFEHFKEQKT